jgi:Raf kinase inhibitor-like YbhB/YbcL family protein
VRAAPALVFGTLALIVGACGGASSSNTTTTTGATDTSSATSATTDSTSAASTSAASTSAASTSAASTRSSVTLASGFHLTSPAFRANGPIPRVYTCDGRGVSLPVHWSGVPRATKELVLVMRDPDAPGGPFIHWALAGIPSSTSGFPAGGVRGHVVPGRNSSGALGYTGPCPPAGAKAHHYVLTLSALASSSGLRPGFNPDQLQSQALGIATLIGTYARR